MNISVVLVTYNRKQCLEKLLDALKKQTQPIRNLYILDNHSTDGTAEMLEKQGYIAITTPSCNQMYKKQTDGFTVNYFYNESNTGGSGGFSKVVELALCDKPCDYFWIMDDDVLPEPTCLQRMLNHMSGTVHACIPNRTDENYDDRACVRLNLSTPFASGMMKRKQFAPLPLMEDTYSVVDMPFEGPLIAYDIVKKVGLPDASYFILCDDTDYAQRILRDTPILFVTDAILHRQLAKKINRSASTYGILNWRDYYGIRNSILFMHRYGNNWVAKHISTLTVWLFWVTLTCVKGRWKNMRIIRKAIYDGSHNISGTTVKPGEF